MEKQIKWKANLEKKAFLELTYKGAIHAVTNTQLAFHEK